MAPPVQTTYSTSTFETLYPTDSQASEGEKLLRVSRSYKSQTMLSLRKIINIKIYGYIRTEAQMSSETEKRERAAMQQRFSAIRDRLVQEGIPSDRLWVGGVAFASNMGGQINVYTDEVTTSSLILPPYAPYVPSTDPPKPSGGKEQWLDAEGSVKKDALKGTIAIEVEVSLKEGGIFRTKPPISVKAAVKSDGTIELGAELVALEKEIVQKAAWGTVQEVKFKISVEGGAGFKYDKDEQRFTRELNAAVKAALSANLVIPGTKIKLPVEVSIGVGVDGKVVPGLQFTYKW